MVMKDPVEFIDAVPEGALMGIDNGKKFIGISISDTTRIIATPKHVIKRGKFSSVCSEIDLLIQEYGICGIVMGLPLGLDGNIGSSAQSAMTFARNLSAKINIHILLWDERFSSSAANRMLEEHDIKTKKQRGMVDRIASAYILQGFLDRITFRL